MHFGRNRMWVIANISRMHLGFMIVILHSIALERLQQEILYNLIIRWQDKHRNLSNFNKYHIHKHFVMKQNKLIMLCISTKIKWWSLIRNQHKTKSETNNNDLILWQNIWRLCHMAQFNGMKENTLKWKLRKNGKIELKRFMFMTKKTNTPQPHYHNGITNWKEFLSKHKKLA